MNITHHVDPIGHVVVRAAGEWKPEDVQLAFRAADVGLTSVGTSHWIYRYEDAMDTWEFCRHEEGCFALAD